MRFARVLVFIMAVCLVSIEVSASEVLYSRVNIHTQEVIDRRGNSVFKASYANYTDPGAGHVLFPAGTALKVDRISSRLIQFSTVENSQNIQLEYHEPRMAMDVREYLSLITSDQPIDTARFSALDQKGIAEGRALIGMSKDGVMAALGYPATHRTPNLEQREWVYWTNRFATRVIQFDDAGVVARIRD